MASLSIHELKQILNCDISVKDRYKNYKFDNFIETGTHLGHTAFHMANYFANVYSVEIKDDLYKECVHQKQRLNARNVSLYFGDSSKMFPDILKKVQSETIFFLDGHDSQGGTGPGDKDCPLLEELEYINQHHNFNSVIIIDDLRLFGIKGNEDWSDITEQNILKCFDSKRVFKTFSIGDRYNIFLTTEVS